MKEMEERQKQKKRMELGKTCGFRPDDKGLVDMFNLAMEATGADIKELCVLAIKHGLSDAARELVAKRREAEKRMTVLEESERKRK